MLLQYVAFIASSGFGHSVGYIIAPTYIESGHVQGKWSHQDAMLLAKYEQYLSKRC